MVPDSLLLRRRSGAVAAVGPEPPPAGRAELRRVKLRASCRREYGVAVISVGRSLAEPDLRKQAIMKRMSLLHSTPNRNLRRGIRRHRLLRLSTRASSCRRPRRRMGRHVKTMRDHPDHFAME